jgi:hypothetical protein
MAGRRRTPLKLIHFRPTSRINSAVVTARALSWEDVARWNNSVNDSGEFMVIVAAVCQNMSHVVQIIEESEGRGNKQISSAMTTIQHP